MAGPGRNTTIATTTVEGIARSRRGCGAALVSCQMVAWACASPVRAPPSEMRTRHTWHAAGGVDVDHQASAWLAGSPADAGKDPVLSVSPDPALLTARAIGFVHAIGAGNVGAIAPHLSKHAIAIDSRGSETPLAELWSRRFKQLDYRIAGAHSPIFASDVVVVASSDNRAAGAVARLRPRPLDQLVHLPFMRTTYEGQVLFADEWWLLLRQIDGQWRIVACLDDLGQPH